MGIVPRRYDEPKQPLRLGANPASKELGYAAGVLARFSSSVTVATSGTTELTLATLNVIVGANRILKISYLCFDVSHNIAGDIFDMRIRRDGTQIAAIRHRVPSNDIGGRSFWCFDLPSSGSHIYTITTTRTSGTGIETHSSGGSTPIQAIVEDIGAA